MTDPDAQAAEDRAHEPPECLRNDDRLRVWRVAGETTRLIVCFSGVGRDSMTAPVPEFMRLAGWAPRDHLLFIADPSRSWLNRPGLIEDMVALIEAEVARIGATKVFTLGHSMGGFSAMVIPAFTKVDVAVALSPQYSLDLKVVPTEKRWAQFREKIAEFRISNAADYLRPNTQYYVFMGRHPVEAPQRDLVKPADNLQLFVMPGVKHDTSQRLKEAGLLDGVVAACFEGRGDHVKPMLKKAFPGPNRLKPANAPTLE
jgi:pimeloyl-ACP methyl ester carboxylesterase